MHHPHAINAKSNNLLYWPCPSLRRQARSTREFLRGGNSAMSERKQKPAQKSSVFDGFQTLFKPSASLF